MYVRAVTLLQFIAIFRGIVRGEGWLRVFIHGDFMVFIIAFCYIFVSIYLTIIL